MPGLSRALRPGQNLTATNDQKSPCGLKLLPAAPSPLSSLGHLRWQRWAGQESSAWLVGRSTASYVQLGTWAPQSKRVLS